MKFKKIISAILACAVMATFFVFPASAGKLTFIPGGGANNYLLKVTAIASIYAMDYSIGSSITLKNGLPGDSVSISSSGKSAVSGKILGGNYIPRLNDSKINTGNITFGFMTDTDKLLAGNIGKFTWVGYIEFNDKTKSPKDDYGLDLNNLIFDKPIQISNIMYDGKAHTIDLIQSVTGVVEVISSSKVYTSGQDITLASNFGNGKGLTRAEQEALVNGKDFSVTVTLNKALTEGAASFTFSTSNIPTAIPAYIFNGATSVKFTVPKEYIYDSDYGVLFNSLRITGPSGYDYTSITLDYTDGSTTTNNNNNNNNSNQDDEAVDEFIINYGNITLNVGSSVNLKTNYSNVKWRSSSSSTIRVFTNGKITALKTGSATITGTNANNDTVTCKVTAINSNRPTTSAKFSVTGGTCYVGLSYSLAGKLAVSPSNYTDRITWTSSDTNIATVNSSGRVTIHDVGIVTIVATTSSGRSSTMKLKCNMPSISLARSSITLSTGGTHQISASAKPGSATLTYNSTNENVATVSKSGKITAVGKGTARITIATNKGAGASRTFTVTVK